MLFSPQLVAKSRPAAAAAVGATFASFDGTGNDVTLSNANLTATHSSTTSGGIRSTSLKNSGKFYFEVTIGTVNGGQSSIGILTAGGVISDMWSAGINCAGIFNFSSGVVFSNNSSHGGTGGVLTNGETIGVAVDFTNQKIWFWRSFNSEWDGNGTDAPATNTGGYSISTFSGTTLAPAITFTGNSSEAFTANFGQSAFVNAAPSGFTAGWPV